MESILYYDKSTVNMKKSFKKNEKNRGIWNKKTEDSLANVPR